MNRIKFIALVVLMSLSLIGIICLQAYYINNSINAFENQFKNNIKKTLDYVVQSIEKDEKLNHTIKIKELIAKGEKIDTTAIINFYIKEEDKNNNKTLIYRNGILEENFKLSSALFDIGLDSINIKRIINQRETKTLENNNLDRAGNISGILSEMSTISEREQILWDAFYTDYAYRTPLQKRTSTKKINELLKYKLEQDEIDLDYDFAIYSNNLETRIKTEDFNIKGTSIFSLPIFSNRNDKNNYRLLVSFPNRNGFMFSSIITNLLLSILFTGIIILAFSSALLQLIKQRQISEIKTDFINNMTHEFKTPIATINLALDAIKNPKTINDKEKILRYLKMIKEENKRMHSQVENVLRISRLEKNELNIRKERLDLHDLVEDAISHIQLIVEDKKGKVKVDLKSSKVFVLANETHFTNVIVNILDNAIKYTPEDKALNIEVSTELVDNLIMLKIKDFGAGMSKIAQKRVFEKFYREHTGNVHNVKGHGLGLAYVKQIIDDHQGDITVESEKGTGSTFIIRLPLIS